MIIYKIKFIFKSLNPIFLKQQENRVSPSVTQCFVQCLLSFKISNPISLGGVAHLLGKTGLDHARTIGLQLDILEEASTYVNREHFL